MGLSVLWGSYVQGLMVPPKSLLKDTSQVDRDDSFVIDDGKGPVKEFPFSSKVFNFNKLPMVLGILPTRLFSESFRVTMSVNLPIDVGILPSNLFRLTYKYVRPVRQLTDDDR